MRAHERAAMTPEEYEAFKQRKAAENRDYRNRRAEKEKRARLEAARLTEELRLARTRPLGLGREQVEWREEWLASAVQLLYPVFASRGYTLPDKIRVSLGWPTKKNWLGCCFDPSASSGAYVEIFICPTHTEALRVFDTLIHELCHAAVGCKHKHRKPFVECAHAMGLTIGTPSACGGFGNPAWHDWADSLVGKLGTFPHDPMSPLPRKVQTTRLRKLKCGQCGFTMRVAAQWIEGKGLRCPDEICMAPLTS